MNVIIQEWRPRLYLRCLGPLCGRWPRSHQLLASSSEVPKAESSDPSQIDPVNFCSKIICLALRQSDEDASGSVQVAGVVLHQE